MTGDQLKGLIRETVEEKLEEMLGDPDWGLELKDAVRERLKRSLEETERGVSGIPVDDVVKKTGLRCEYLPCVIGSSEPRKLHDHPRHKRLSR